MAGLMQPPSYVEPFRRVVAMVASEHGDPSVAIFEPQTRLRRVTAVWFIGGDNYGMHVDGHPDGGTKPRIEAWGRCGPCSYTVLVPANGIVTTDVVEFAARAVGLLPATGTGLAGAGRADGGDATRSSGSSGE